jgi:hypothetical protein
MILHEQRIIAKLNTLTNSEIVLSQEQYNRFDAQNDKGIFEIKHRHTFYEDLFIEFEKYSYNLMYALELDLQFFYVVSMQGVIYMFDIVKLDQMNYDYQWHWKALPSTTEFENNDERNKFVGLLNLGAAFLKLDDNGKGNYNSSAKSGGRIISP